MGDRLREAGITQGDAATAEVATALWSGTHGICMLAVTGKLQVATQASVQRLLELLLDSFLAAPAGKAGKPRRAK